LRDYCLAYGIPLLSGKDSMYIDGNLKGPFGERHKVSGLPTLMFTICSVIKDIARCVTMDAKFPGDLVYILGETRNELGGSEYYHMMGAIGLNVPQVNAEEVWPGYLALHKAIQEGLVSSCHAVSRGGLAVHLALIAMAGELGMEINVAPIPRALDITLSQALYSESCGRFVITVPPGKKELFEKLFVNLKMAQVGIVIESPRFWVRDGRGAPIIEEDVSTLKNSWKKPFGELV
jgi:phosphoribosylformylglycinamidine (FGAM) synthase-like enzyme